MVVPSLQLKETAPVSVLAVEERFGFMTTKGTWIAPFSGGGVAFASGVAVDSFEELLRNCSRRSAIWLWARRDRKRRCERAESIARAYYRIW
jgi:hypothetical protein